MSKIHLCIVCLEKDPENFYEGRYSLCKKCRNKEKNKTSKIRKLETKDPKDLNNYINNHLLNDVDVFGSTIFQIITDYKERIEILEEREKILSKMIIDYQVQFAKFKNFAESESYKIKK
jgi:hypothetical protein